MNRTNIYIEKEDYTPLRTFCLKFGERREYGKREFFCRAGDRTMLLGYIVTGGVHYVCTDADGTMHTIGFRFEEDFAADYPSFLQCKAPAVDILTLERSVIYTITREQLHDFIESSAATQRLARRIGERLFIAAYERLLASYTTTPEQRYLNLLAEYRDILNRVPMKIIASFIGIAPESLSRIRQRIAGKQTGRRSAPRTQ